MGKPAESFLSEEDPLKDWREWEAEMKAKEAQILRQPRVSEWISELEKKGADRKAILRFLAFAGDPRTEWEIETMRQKQKRLRVLELSIIRDARQLQEIRTDFLGLPDFWMALATGDWDDAKAEKRSRTITNVVDELLMIAKAVGADARIFDSLVKASRERVRVKPILALMSLLRQQTGAFHDRLLADLLAAAHQASGSSGSFTEEQLNKLRQRKGRGLVKAKRADPMRGPKGGEI